MVPRDVPARWSRDSYAPQYRCARRAGGPQARFETRLDREGFLGLLGLLTAFILVRNLFHDPKLFLQIVINGLQLGFVYALIALGYTMVYGIVS